jgi:hypothetical protein
VYTTTLALAPVLGQDPITLLLRLLAVLTLGAVVTLIGRFVLSIAWKLVIGAAVIVGLVLAAMLFVPILL